MRSIGKYHGTTVFRMERMEYLDGVTSGTLDKAVLYLIENHLCTAECKEIGEVDREGRVNEFAHARSIFTLPKKEEIVEVAKQQDAKKTYAEQLIEMYASKDYGLNKNYFKND